MTTPIAPLPKANVALLVYQVNYHYANFLSTGWGFNSGKTPFFATHQPCALSIGHSCAIILTTMTKSPTVATHNPKLAAATTQ